MEDDREVRKQRQRLARLHEQLESLLGRVPATLDEAASEASTDAGRWDHLQSQLQQLTQDYLAQSTTFIDLARDRAREIEEEAKRRAAMSEQRSSQPRDEARIKELSDELSTKLRLDRVDAAIKELMDFLADAEFFAANASTGRRRKLKALGNAIEKGLGK